MSVLQAEWRKLAFANYETEVSLLSDYLPYGTEPDLWQGRCYLSLVGFMFVNTRLLGIKIPFHVNFEEINLRFYVKRREGDAWKRGVVFIKEIVPRAAISFVANTLYGEKYETLPMRHHWEEQAEQTRRVTYCWKKNKVWQEFGIKASRQPTAIEADSETAFITQHFWGYGRVNETTTYEYEVRHPAWDMYEVLDHDIRVDFGKVYGENFSFLNGRQPASVMLAEGSSITVENRRKLSGQAVGRV